MKKIKIAYISTTGLDVFPLISALKELETEKGDLAEVILRSKDDLADPKTMNEFMSFAAASDLAILSLHGGKAILNSFDEIAFRLKDANVPVVCPLCCKISTKSHVKSRRAVNEITSSYFFTRFNN